jgi:hypothetical protein
MNNEAVTAGNEELRHELDMYKSVMVPIDEKPRTNITRVGRVPFANQSLNTVDHGAASATRVHGHDRVQIENGNGDMRLEEIT